MLRRRSIRLRIIVLVLVPVLGLLGLYAAVLNLTIGKIVTLRQEAQIWGLVVMPVSNVQQQLANERGAAMAYLVSPGRADRKSLVAQGHRTDLAIKRFDGALRAALNSGPEQKEQQALVSWRADLNTVDGLRSSAISRALNKIDAAGAYSTIIESGDNVLSQAIVPVLSGPLGIQAADLLTMARASQAFGEESDLVSADLRAGSVRPEDLPLIGQLAVLHQEETTQTLPDLDPKLRDAFVSDIPQSAAGQVASLESDLLSGPSAARKVSDRAWTSAATPYRHGFRSALMKDMAVLADEARSQAKQLELDLLLVAGIGLLAIVAAAVVGIILGRDLIRQLTELRQSAVRLSIEQLPAAIRRLRAGHEVDVEAEVPQLEPGRDEIGQVREAFNAAARTAIAAAVDEIKIRHGVNDVFRSLARRNQSLLTRQLHLLDTMERRVHDPEELADLFRVDHMTTRMRRHAEGLLIVAGGSSGRTWREPVPVVDVIRASAAEVEDYARIKVNSRTSAAIAGHAVADIIHMLAELLENATTFSPTNTPVRVEGERVGRGVVVEIEDRGLGMSQYQLVEINATLVDPPLFDLAGSDQLGLFIAGQLAKRHGIKITLRSSAYGGVTAVVLIPNDQVIDVPEADDGLGIAGIRELGGRPIPALPAAPAEPVMSVAAGTPVIGQGQGTELDKRVPSQSRAEPGLQGERSEPGVGSVAASSAMEAGAPAPPDRRPGIAGLTWGEAGILEGTWAERTTTQAPAAQAPEQAAAAEPDAATAGTAISETAITDSPRADTAAPETATEEAAPAAATSAPADAPAAEAIQAEAAPAAATSAPADAPAAEAVQAEAAPAEAVQAEASAEHASAPTASPSAPPDEAPAAAAPIAATAVRPMPASPSATPESTEPAAGQSDLDGLPIRVRQANLAPQLRRADAPDPAALADEPTGMPSPDAARSTMAALQLGWRRGRAAAAPEDDEQQPPAAAAAPDGDPQQPPAAAAPQDDHQAVSAHEDDRPESRAVTVPEDEAAQRTAVSASVGDPPEPTAGGAAESDRRKPPASAAPRTKRRRRAQARRDPATNAKTSPRPSRPGDQPDEGGSE